MNVRIYTRVSHEEQLLGKSLDAQKKSLLEYAKANNMNVVKEYCDAGISASTIEKRKAFKKMLDEVQPNETILFTKLDRFSRNILDANLVVKNLDKINVNIKAIQEDDIDTSTPDGRFIFNLKLSLAQREREVTGMRIKNVLDYKKSKGEIITGKHPIGYKIIDKKAYIDDEESKKVIDLFDIYISTHSIRKTKEIFNNKYNTQYGDKNIAHMLKNEKYKGDTIYPQIISDSVYMDAKSILSSKYVRYSRNNFYVFSGLLRCGYCGARLNSAPKKIKNGISYNYKCNSSNSYINKSCFCMVETKIEKMIIEQVEEDLKNTLINESYVSEQNDINDRINNLKAKQTRIKEAFIDGILDRQEMNERIHSIQMEINELNAKEKSPNTIQLDDNALNIYKSFDRQQKSAFWKTLIDNVYVYKDHVDIEYKKSPYR